jgi:DNA segregation ATPase FtsK/SpoIIIE-like protein
MSYGDEWLVEENPNVPPPEEIKKFQDNLTHYLKNEPQAYDDPLMSEAKELCRVHGFAGTTLLQRNLKIGYTRAAMIIDKMITAGFVEKESLPNTGVRLVIKASHPQVNPNQA